jgi:periplasmic copper chaperone A
MKRVFGLRVMIVWLALLLVGCGSLTNISSSGSLQVDEVWARPGLAGGSSAVYFVIDNQLGRAETLISAQSDVAMVTELHMSSIDDAGTMKMMHQDKVPVPDNQKLEFKPGGLHVMLMNLKEDLKEGDHFTVTLTFEEIGQMQVEAEVRTP